MATTATGSTSPSPNKHKHHNHDTTNDQVQEILRSAGIESCPMDPSSLEALQSMLLANANTNTTTSGTNHTTLMGKPKTEGVTDRTSPTPVTSSSRSTATTATTTPFREPPNVDWRTTTSNNDTSNVNTTNNNNTTSQQQEQILQHLQYQTQLLQDLQGQVQALTAQVQRLEQGGGGSSGTVTTSRSRDTTTAPPPPILGRDLPPPILPPPHVAAAAVAQQPPQQPSWFFTHIRAPIQNSRLLTILQLYHSQSQPHVRGWDGSLLFKLVFLLLIVGTRLQRHEASDRKRLVISITLMVVGFLYHTHYLQFTYRFVVQDRVPQRVWNGTYGNENDGDNGQDQEDNPRNNRRRPMPPAAARPRAAPVWNPYMIAGGIARRHNPQPQQPFAMIRNGLQDVLYLFGSFVFSIFPMWRPQGEPLPPPPNGNNDGGADEIPPVAPPRNAMEPVDDDDDEDNVGDAPPLEPR